MEAIVRVLAVSSVRATIIALAVGVVLWVLRVRSPAIRHRAWTSVLAAMLLLPVLSAWGPKIAVPLLSPAPAVLLPKPASPAPEWKIPHQLEESAPAAPEPDANVRSSVASQRATAGAGRPAPQLGIYGIAAILYLAGFLALMTRLLVGMFLSYRLVRAAGLHDRDFCSPRCAVPLTVGLLHHRILLPEGSKDWDPDKLDAVLAHEREHVRRRDPLVEWLALLNRGIYWFHPLAWWLCRKLAALAEQACDDAVLARGHDPDKYAELLLELARSVKRGGTLVTVWGSSLDGSTLAVRIRRIVTAGRSPTLSRLRVALVAALCAGAILVPATCEIVRAQAVMSGLSASLLNAQVDTATVQYQSGRFDSRNLLDRKVVPDLPRAVKNMGDASAAHAAVKADFRFESPQQNREAALKDAYKKWLNEDVVYIITAEEKAVFLALTTDEEREMFIAQFWARREQDTRAGDGQFKKEHYRRLAYANERFATSAGVPGWRTDRGHTYISYGEPDRRVFWEGGGETSVYPFERWYYRHIEGFGDDVTIEFMDKTRVGNFVPEQNPVPGVARPGSPAKGSIIPSPTPLASESQLPYTLEIKIADRLSNRTVVTGADFQVIRPPS
jgi:GWxTD domain-containing protein